MAKLLTPFGFIKICNIKLTGLTKIEKMANSTPGGDIQPTRRTKKFSQKSTRCFPDMRFSRGVHRNAEFSDSTIKNN